VFDTEFAAGLYLTTFAAFPYAVFFGVVLYAEHWDRFAGWLADRAAKLPERRPEPAPTPITEMTRSASGTETPVGIRG
jgi:hypothetical protein